MADNDTCISITPNGHIGKCDHYTNNNFVSHIDSDEWDEEILQSFRETNEEIDACATCFDYPNCFMAYGDYKHKKTDENEKED